MIYYLKFLQEHLSTTIESSKERYYARIANRLNNTQKSSKIYKFLLKIFLNNKKILLIPPLFHEDNFITEFKEKAELFNSFSSNQCPLLKNCRKLPANLRYVTDKRLHATKFKTENILAPNQSGFKPGDSCFNQLLSITHEIYSSFEDGFKVRSVFLDISKAFDKIWHEGIIFKLKQNAISDDLLNILSDFLRNRKQRVTLNGHSSSWTNVNAGVPQLRSITFLIYINDLPDGLLSNAKLFADDTSLISVVHDINTSTISTIELNSDLKKISDLVFQWKMTFNPDRSK